MHFPRWKYYVLLLVLIIGFIYALPNIYGEDEAVQITALQEREVSEETLKTIESILSRENLKAKSMAIENDATVLVRFSTIETQLKAKDLIKNDLGEGYSVALNLAPRTPHWLEMLGANPMKLGLDLRGGVHLLLEVDLQSIIARRVEGYYLETPKLLREAKIRYSKIERNSSDNFRIFFDSEKERDNALAELEKHHSELALQSKTENGKFFIEEFLTPETLLTIRNDTVEQTIATLRKRVNELGVAEAIVQRQGLNRVVVELPGIQDTAYAKDILGKTATLKFLMEDNEHDLASVISGHPVVGSKIYVDRNKRPVLLKINPILTGEAITGATTGQDRDGRPAVNIRLGGDIALFSKTTLENVGHRMAVLYIESKEGKTQESLISLATIQSPLGSSFQVNGLSMQEARDLALLLRAGSLPTSVSIVEESIVGPSMGQDNIRMGMISVASGLLLVLIFMTLYYSVFGLIANIALLANLVLLLALMSLIGATLTLPGIAGIVLTLGMAVDANVLIFERIREELRSGMSPQASIQRGFQYAFATIIDSNLTTLIVGVVLFSMGSGPVKGFAVTLCLGILTSLLTATTGSRAIVQLLYGGRSIKHIRVGV